MDSISKDFGYWVKENQIAGLNGYGKEGFYVSEDALRDYWNENLVGDVLYRASTYRQTLSPPKLIIQSYIRIFSILIYITTPSLPSLAYLGEFLEKGFNDHRLPLGEGEFPNTPEGAEVETKFLQFQFLFSPVVFDPQLYQREFDSRCVLPLTFQRRLSGRSGSSANSAITKLYKLQKASKLQAKEDLVVIKEYPKNEIEHSFKNELKAYLSFQSRGDGDNVSAYFLKYYGSFKQNDKGFIILEFADEGSLLEFFKSNKVPRTREELHGFFENLSGLLFGLRLLHAQNLRKTNKQLRGVHQDLKPANIFVCRNEHGGAYKYNFKIGDFGLTSFTPNEANEIKSRDNKGGIMYSAPEMTNYDDFSRSLDEGISHFVDVWSFGCVLFEAAVWAISDERGREEFRSLRCEENDQNTLLRDQGYGASFHNGTRRLYAVDKMLELILEQRRVFDDLTEGFCNLLLKYSMVPIREHRCEANELGAVVKEYLDSHRTSNVQSSWVATSPTGRTSSPELDRSNSRSFEYQRTSPVFGNRHYPTSINRSLSGGGRSYQNRFDRGMRINETYILNDPRSSSDLTERAYSENRQNLEQHPSLPSPPLPGNDYEVTVDSGKTITKNDDKIVPQVTERPIKKPSDKQADYPKFRVPDVINWINGGKKHSDELYRRLSPALEKMKKRQQIFIIDDSASVKKAYRSRVIDTFRALAHLTDEVDPDGIELYFISSPDSPKKSLGLKLLNKKMWVERLVEKVEKVFSQGEKQEGTICDMENSISTILDQVKKNIPRKNSKTSIYILTDGIWDDATSSDNIRGVDNAIRSLVGEMRRLNLMRSHISLQFIRFGDSEVAKNRLRYLDDDLAKEFKSYDIVDTTTDSSPVWKILLGSIIGAVDNTADDCAGVSE